LTDEVFLFSKLTFVQSPFIFRSLLLFLLCHDSPAGLAFDLPAHAAVSEREIVALFFERNIDLLAAQFQIDRAEAVEWIASAIPNPELSFGLNELNGVVVGRPTDVGSQGLGYNVFLTQMIITAGKRDLRMESARFGREAVEADFKDTLRILVNRLRHGFYDLLLAQKSLLVAHENMATFDRLAEANRLRESTGDISETELQRVEVERIKAKGELDLAEAMLKTRRSELAKLLNWPEKAMEYVAEDAWPKISAHYDSPKEEGLVERACEERPDLKAQDLRVQQMGKEAELARRLVAPDVNLSGGYLQDAGNLNLDSGAVLATAEVPVFYQYTGQVGRAMADFNDAQNQREQLKNRIRKEVVSALATLRGASAIVNRFEGEVIQRIKKARASVEFAYTQGAAGLIDLLDAERNYKAMMLDYYVAENHRALAYADLLMAIGEEPHS
jgi:cobalt-zinc-cadmium efflux system outer membrane protein